MYATRGADFERKLSPYQKHVQGGLDWSGPVPKIIYGGFSMTKAENDATRLTIAIRDVVYPLDYVQTEIQVRPQDVNTAVTEWVIETLQNYSEKNFEKIIGVGLSEEIRQICPHLMSRLWHELDIVPLAVDTGKSANKKNGSAHWESRASDEQAEFMAMQCVRLFGPDNVPLLQVGYRGVVEVDSGLHVHISSLEDYQNTVSPQTWNMLQLLSTSIQQKGTRIALFSATPQGGGVALIRHAFMRLGSLLNLNIKWYVPRGRPSVFRVTKMNHNILQGVAKDDDYLSMEDEKLLREWVLDNCNHLWCHNGGPLDNPSDGGADIIIVDDPQMPDLIPIAKENAPNRPVIYRNHIQIRNDLASKPGSPQARSWNWLWDRAQHADVFISHPIPESVPSVVPEPMRGYMPASTDMLDGLNKHMRDWDIMHYGRLFNRWCQGMGTTTIDYSRDEYFTQIARFDPSKGIFDALDAYHIFYERAQSAKSVSRIPKLVICGHGSVDDPDAIGTYHAVISHIQEKMPLLQEQICVVRAKPSDQVLNAILSKAKVVLQLSTCEGFEVKVSEALHKGKPVIATRVGGLPYQIKDGETGFLEAAHDPVHVADRLYQLWSDDDLYHRMQGQTLKSHMDEITTAGHLSSWLYLVTRLLEDNGWRPHDQSLYKLACNDLHVGTGTEYRTGRVVGST